MFSNQSVRVQRVVASLGADRPRVRVLRLVLLCEGQEIVPGRRDLEAVLLEVVRLVPDRALRIRLRDDAVDRVVDGGETRPRVAVVLVDRIRVEAHVLERDQRVVRASSATTPGRGMIATSGGLPDASRVRITGRKSRADSYLVSIPDVLRELVEDLLERFLLGSAPEGEDGDRSVSCLRSRPLRRPHRRRPVRAPWRRGRRQE